MRTPKKDHRFKTRFILRSMLLLLPPLVALIVIWRSWTQADHVPWMAVGFFLIWIALWIIADMVMLRHYRCPTCGQIIKGPTVLRRKAGDPIHYYCGKCDIEWDTGLREAGND